MFGPQSFSPADRVIEALRVNGEVSSTRLRQLAGSQEVTDWKGLISLLLRDGHIVVRTAKTKPGKGRKAILYSLPHN